MPIVQPVGTKFVTTAVILTAVMIQASIIITKHFAIRASVTIKKAAGIIDK